MSTLAELRNELADQLNRSDLDDQIDEAVNRSITFYQNFCFWFNEERSSANTTQGEDYYPLPADFVAPISLVLINQGKNHPLHYRNAVWMHENYDHESQSVPDYYTIIDEQIRVMPEPDSTYTFYLHYYKKIPAPVEDTEITDWSTGIVEQLIMYRTKRDIYVNYLHDLILYGEMRLLETETLKQVKEVSTKIQSSGEMQPDGELSVYTTNR